MPLQCVSDIAKTGRKAMEMVSAVNKTHSASLVHLIGLYGRAQEKRLGLLDYKIEKQLFISTKSPQD